VRSSRCSSHEELPKAEIKYPEEQLLPILSIDSLRPSSCASRRYDFCRLPAWQTYYRRRKSERRQRCIRKQLRIKRDRCVLESRGVLRALNLTHDWNASIGTRRRETRRESSGSTGITGQRCPVGCTSVQPAAAHGSEHGPVWRGWEANMARAICVSRPPFSRIG